MTDKNKKDDQTAARKASLSAPAGSLSLYTRMQDSDGDWICAPNNGGDVGDMLDAIDELNALLVALHDAINRPKGVVPKSAERFHQANR